VVAEFEYAGGVDRHVYLFDIDACGPPTLVGADVYDDVESAATAWRAMVATAGSAPAVAAAPESWRWLVEAEAMEELIGSETRNRLDNWYRAGRRIHVLGDALDKSGVPRPPAEPSYGDIDVSALLGEFLAWHEQRTGAVANQDAAEALVEEWPQGLLPETRERISPHRVEYQLGLMADWWAEDDLTAAVLGLFPAWTRFLGERAGLPDDLIEGAVRAAHAEPDGTIRIGCPTAIST
jgi:hypothetical protein